MLDTQLNLVASYFSVSNKERFFLSKSENFFDVPFTNLIGDNRTISNYLDDIIYNITTIPKSEHYLYNLLSVVKIENIVNINYSVLLPDKIQTRTNIYAIKSNLAMIDPLVRKAMAYV